MAKVQRYADRAAREAKIEDAVTEFYLASNAYETAVAAMTTARAGMAAQVEALLTDLKEPVSGVAVLCDITAAQVRALRKEATTAVAETATAATETAVDPEPDSVDTSTPNETEPARSVSPTGADTDRENGRNRDDERDGAETGAASDQRRAS